ncbi:MAG TPA: HAD family phosphatase [Candidatus Limnocylindrales bacterium]|nr:HAD family phosphatase [Candidatus Limnocylindrales bacterium]
MSDARLAANEAARPTTDAPLSLPGRFRAVVFDMDGLLFDSEAAWEAAERDLLARHGAVLTEADRLASLGRAVDEVIGWYLVRIGWGPERAAELRDELIGLVGERYAEIQPMPGARELIERLRGRVRLGLASNTDRPLVDHALAAAGLTDAFDAVVSAQDVAAPKPAPDLYRLVCERLGVPPSEAVALEDSGTGVASAKAAGMACIAVPQLDGLDVSAADRIVDSLERLLET